MSAKYTKFAGFYDGLTRNVDYKKRAAYIAELLKRIGHTPGLTLDLACGTGSLTVELCKMGFDIFGADSSQDMLSIAQQKACEQGLDILFLRQKMQELDLYGTIDTCICTLDSLNHLTVKSDVQKTFDKVSLFMNPGGVFLFDVNTVYKHREILRGNTFIYDTSDVYCIWQNTPDRGRDTVHITLDFFEREGALYRRSGESFSERAYPHGELCAMLDTAGFDLVSVYGELSLEAPEKDSQRNVYLARKRSYPDENSKE